MVKSLVHEKIANLICLSWVRNSNWSSVGFSIRIQWNEGHMTPPPLAVLHSFLWVTWFPHHLPLLLSVAYQVTGSEIISTNSPYPSKVLQTLNILLQKFPHRKKASPSHKCKKKKIKILYICKSVWRRKKNVHNFSARFHNKLNISVRFIFHCFLSFHFYFFLAHFPVFIRIILLWKINKSIMKVFSLSDLLSLMVIFLMLKFLDCGNHSWWESFRKLWFEHGVGCKDSSIANLSEV